MKKILSVFVAMCIVLMTSITAFAAQAPSADKVKKQIEGAVAYLTADAEKYGIDQAVDFSIFADAGADVSKFADGFIADVKANLDANNGKIVSSYGENLATYGAVITALAALGENTADFYGYNIEKAFMAMDPAVVPVTPNYYLTIMNGAFLCEDSDAFLEALCDTYIREFYTMGKGADFYGYSCDNTAYFAAAISYGNYQLGKYADVLDDAMTIIDSYKVEGGYCFNPEYGTEPNSDSTALALLANSSYYGDNADITKPETFTPHFEKLNSIYADLCTFESTTTGVFKYDDDESAYSTKDALTALSSYYWDAVAQEIINAPDNNEEQPKPTVPTQQPTEKQTTAAAAENKTTAKADKSKKSPATGADTTIICASAALLTAAGVMMIVKKKEK